MQISPLTLTGFLLILFLFSNWAELLLHGRKWFKYFNKVVHTAFFTSAAYLFYDFASWEGEAHMQILRYVDSNFQAFFAILSRMGG